MSQLRVKLVREMIASWNSNDRDPDHLRLYLDPSIELSGPLASVSGEPYRGIVGIERWMHGGLGPVLFARCGVRLHTHQRTAAVGPGRRSRLSGRLAGSYGDIVIAADELLDLRNGVVFGVYLQSAKLEGAAGRVTQREAMVAVIAEGLVERLIIYPQAAIDDARGAAEQLAKERE